MNSADSPIDFGMLVVLIAVVVSVMFVVSYCRKRRRRDARSTTQIIQPPTAKNQELISTLFKTLDDIHYSKKYFWGIKAVGVALCLLFFDVAYEAHKQGKGSVEILFGIRLGITMFLACLLEAGFSVQQHLNRKYRGVNNFVRVIGFLLVAIYGLTTFSLHDSGQMPHYAP